MKPETAGLRFRPPVELTAVGQAEAPQDTQVLLRLLDAHELEICIRWLHSVAWKVLAAQSPQEVAMFLDSCPVSFLVTDDTLSLEAARMTDERRLVPVVVFTDDDRNSFMEAFRNGTDWVVTRPLNAGNPLQVIRYG